MKMIFPVLLNEITAEMTFLIVRNFGDEFIHLGVCQQAFSHCHTENIQRGEVSHAMLLTKRFYILSIAAGDNI